MLSFIIIFAQSNRCGHEHLSGGIIHNTQHYQSKASAVRTWQKRTLCSLAWTDHGECRCLRLLHTSRTLSSGLRESSCKWGCQLSGIPYPQSAAAVCCSSSWMYCVRYKWPFPHTNIHFDTRKISSDSVYCITPTMLTKIVQTVKT